MSETVSKLRSYKDLYVVGIGASAGGLDAIQEFFENVPENSGLSFVIIQHLSPDYKSLLAELLSKHTKMTVFEAEDGMYLKPNEVYVIPTKNTITIKNGRLRLTEKSPVGPNTAVDIFFNSLAEEKKEHAIAVILSGTGSDGTKGIAAIKKAGGMAIAQDPVSAKFDGMPQSAIASGNIDYVLTPELMAVEILNYIREGGGEAIYTNGFKPSDESILQDILKTVHGHTSCDFTMYKRPTLHRRIAKRMAEQKIGNLYDYLNLLNDNPIEIETLCKEFLIGVTKFFRDREAFEQLKKRVIPEIVKSKKPSDPIKIWVPACSTGEEAYSIAILFEEYLREKNINLTVKVFATDIDKEAVHVAAKGIYLSTIEEDVIPKRLETYFTKEGNKYTISPDLRKNVIFAQHDITKDTPFIKIDLVSCRNMLIYMNSELQSKVLSVIHFSLNLHGFLFLGSSEHIGGFAAAFSEISKKWKIFQNITLTKPKAVGVINSPPLLIPSRSNPSRFLKTNGQGVNVPEIFNDIVCEHYGFAGIYIDENYELKNAFGEFRKYLRFPEKKFNFNLLKMVSEDLSIALGTGIRRALKSSETVEMNHVKVREDNEVHIVDIICKPLIPSAESVLRNLLIILKTETTKKTKAGEEELFSNDKLHNQRLMDLEMELKETKETLQQAIEELETSNEELQSSNEELLSANEELQSTNEELQSLNEELHTVNTEHQQKIKELIELNDDMNNYFKSTDIGQIFIDKNLIIRKFTPVAVQQVNLIENDIGRPITHISMNIHHPKFVEDIQAVISDGKTIEREVSGFGDKCYQMRILPYVRQDKRSDGVIVNFIDITTIKRLNTLITGVFNSSLTAIIALKAIRNDEDTISDFAFTIANSAFNTLFELGQLDVADKRLSEIIPDFFHQMLKHLKVVVRTGKTYHKEHVLKISSGERWLELEAVKMADGVVISCTDITEKKQVQEQIQASYNELMRAEEELRKLNEELGQRNRELQASNYDLMQFASVASHDLKEPLRKIITFGSMISDKYSQQLDDKGQFYLKRITSASTRMQTLIEDLLSFSKLSNKSVAFNKVDLNKVVKEILVDLEMVIQQKNATIETGDLPVIEGVPGQIRQLFQNLISNALKFQQKGMSPHIVVSAEVLEPDNTVKLYFKDNGIGIDEKYQQRIFEIFQRLHSKEEYEGTGIGLAIVKKIIENHNGSINVESKLNGGTCFILEFPMVQSSTMTTVLSK